jgi:hypothetical protein
LGEHQYWFMRGPRSLVVVAPFGMKAEKGLDGMTEERRASDDDAAR